MKHHPLSHLSLVAALLMVHVQSCAATARGCLGEPAAGNLPHRGENAVLAGEWEYEEGGMVVPLKLDRFGNGSYDFKDGRFRTDVLTDHRWAGAWAQRENDREGDSRLPCRRTIQRVKVAGGIPASKGPCADQSRRALPRGESAVDGRQSPGACRTGAH